MELGLKLFFGDTRPPVGQLGTGIRLLTRMSRSTCFLAIFAWISRKIRYVAYRSIVLSLRELVYDKYNRCSERDLMLDF